MCEIETQLSRPETRQPIPAMSAILKLAEIVGAWRQHAVERRRLGSFNDRMLKDIGLSRADIEGEITKPFWRG